MKEFNNLIKIMKRLRLPAKGCPWDRKQTPHSLREYILEEAHELVEAIDENSPKKQCEELGDLLLQVVFLARMHQEAGHFDIKDVISAISQKLIGRHPHIFGRVTVDSAEEVKQNWEKIKRQEKKKSGILSDYPDHMPALSTAKRLAEQASSVGFDWNDPLAALEKVKEEIAELEEVIHSGDKAGIEEELGDFLFATANVARLTGINPELALRQSNRKFKERFRHIEKELAKQNKKIDKATLAEMEALWQEAKKKKHHKAGPKD